MQTINRNKWKIISAELEKFNQSLDSRYKDKNRETTKPEFTSKGARQLNFFPEFIEAISGDFEFTFQKDAQYMEIINFEHDLQALNDKLM